MARELDAVLARLEKDADAPDFTQRVGYTYLIGVYLAVNALRDLYLLVEGPDCTHMKTQYVQGNHDWMSTLTSVAGTHRVANTALHPSHMSGSREAAVHEALMRMASNAQVPAVMMTSMPMAAVTGADYERLAREVQQASGKRIVQVPGKSLSGDWLDGYAQALLGLARSLPEERRQLDPKQIGIVGYLFDRNEADHTGNLRELGRVLRALGFELGSVWLSGQQVSELDRIRSAATILSFPYGRKAAQTVARKTGARLIEVGLPFGLRASEDWIRRLGSLLERDKQAETFVDAELSRIVPKLEWVVPFALQNRTMAYIGDPHLLAGVVDIVESVGASMSFAVITNRPAHALGLQEQFDFDVVVYPKMKGLMRFLTRKLVQGKAHLLITNNAGILGPEGAVLEFGFPSMFRHALYDRPFLCPAGALAFIDSMATSIRMHEVELTRRHMAGQVPRIVRR